MLVVEVGKFPEEIPLEDFLKGKGRSILRNPLIAETMYKSEDIEKWASGLKRIYDECRANQVRVEFEQISMGFLVTFYRPKWEEESRLGEKLGVRLGTNERKVLEILKTNEHLTISELSQKLGISTTATENNISKLKNKGMLKRIGPDKGGYWEVLEFGIRSVSV